MKKLVMTFILSMAIVPVWAETFVREQSVPPLPDITQHQDPDASNIRRTPLHARSSEAETVTFLGYVNQDKLRYAIFNFVDRNNIVATLTGWADSYDYVPNLVVPDNVTYNGQSVPVTTVGDRAFYGGWGITGLTLGKNVECIGQYAFYNCSMTGLTVPASMNLIMYGAFYASKLNSVVFEDASSTDIPLVIGPAAFAYTDIRNIEIPARLKLIDEYSFQAYMLNPFQGCSLLENITVNPNFYVNGSRRNYTLEINQSALCARVESDDSHPEYVYVMAYPASNVRDEFSLSEPFIDVFGGAFERSKITGITLTATLDEREPKVNMTINRLAFASSNISSLNLVANGPVNLRSGFAKDCQNLAAYNLSESITNYKVFDGVLYGKKDDERWLVSYPAGRPDASFTVPDDVLHLDYGSFALNKNIRSITLPAGLKSIGEYSFYGCDNLGQLIYNGSSLESIGDYAFEGSNIVPSAPEGEVCIGNWLIDYKGTVPSNLVISENITEALPGIFKDNNEVTSVVFPADFENIPEYMFAGCGNLRHIRFPGNLKTIGNRAFSGAGNAVTQLLARSETERTLTIPEGVTGIGSYAFSDSRLADKLILPSSVEFIDDFAFAASDPILEVEIHRSTPPSCSENNPNGIFTPGSLAYGKLIIPKDANPLDFTQNKLWNFSKVINGNFTSAEDIEIDPEHIQVYSGSVFSTDGTTFSLYGSDGRFIGRSNSFSGLAHGLYIVYRDSAAQKIMVR